jgi:hypothetical protein
MVMPGKSRTKIAVIGGAALVAAGIAATIFFTRPSSTKEVPAGPAATAPAPEPEPAALAAPPAPPSEPAHGFEPPAPEPQPTHAFVPAPAPVEDSKHHKKGIAGKPKKAGAAPEAPVPTPSPESTSKKDSERW